MPTTRKRIGYLPRAEVQTIIDQICKNNKLSQSKVTGILVEEALTYRGVLKSNSNTKNKDLPCSEDYLQLFNFDILNNKSQKEKFILEENFVKEEMKMINDYIKFKFFKNVMNKNNYT